MDTTIPHQKNNIIIAGILFTVVLLTGWSVGSHYLSVKYGHGLPTPAIFFISRITFWLCLAVVYGYVILREKQPFMLWPERTYPVKHYILSVLITLGCTTVGAIIIGVTLNQLGFNMKSEATIVIRHFAVPLKLLAIVTAAVVEELIFRGYLISRLQLYFTNTHVPVIISSLIFGLGHMGYGTAVNILVPLMIGLVFGYHYQKYRNIKIPIICHFLIDFVALMIAV